MFSPVLATIFRRVPKNSIKFSRTFSTTKMVQIKVGDELPFAELFEDSPANKVNLAEVTRNRKVLIFGVPGAFTPGCSKTHLPGYVKNAPDLKQRLNLSDILCISVNDPFVMSAWGKEAKAAGKIRMLADPAGKFTKCLDLTIDLPPLGGLRSKRYSMIVENGTVSELNVEPDGTGLSCSLADHLMKK